MSEKIFGLLGRKLSHSYSAPIHRELGIADYRLIELEPHELEAFMRRDDIGALNVTIPYKRDALKICDHVSDEALEVGSVNTVVRKPDGKLYGYNTDVFGFLYMADSANIDFKNKKTLIFGSGGASLTAVYAAKLRQASEVIVISRNGENNYENLHLHSDAEVIVNATPVGMYPETDASPASLDLFPKCTGVLDMIYNPVRTRLLIDAEKRGIPYSNGLPMLVAQAKAAEEFFFDRPFPDSEIPRITAALLRETVNVVLVGMPGCGKTTVGNELARLMGREVVDIDSEIVKSAGMSVPEIFAKYGEEHFRKLEREKSAEIGRSHGIIISTGGGVVKDYTNNYPSLHGNGFIVHLERELGQLDRDGRPLSAGADLSKMYEERLPMYKSFRDAVCENRSDPKDAAKNILRMFGDYLDSHIGG